MLKKQLAAILATVFGIGKIPFAPGTFGSLAAFPLATLLYHGFHFPTPAMGVAAGAMLSAIVYIIGIWASRVYMEHTKTHDPSAIVIDEVAGQMLALAIVSPMLVSPELSMLHRWLILIGNFVLFRIFDIFKPWPVSWADQKLHNAHGVMLDDIFAGVYAGCIEVVILLIF